MGHFGDSEYDREFCGAEPVDIVGDVAAFHEKFGLVYEGDPRCLPDELAAFRIKFLREELTEYRLAEAGANKAGMLDALVDLVYVAIGTADLHGFDFREAWQRVHAANMLKVRAKSADQSKRGSAFDVVKPPGWSAPNLSDLVGECDHDVDFDFEASKGMTVEQVRARWPRLNGGCPLYCGFSGIAYASREHYVMGDW